MTRALIILAVCLPRLAQAGTMHVPPPATPIVVDVSHGSGGELGLTINGRKHDLVGAGQQLARLAERFGRLDPVVIRVPTIEGFDLSEKLAAVAAETHDNVFLSLGASPSIFVRMFPEGLKMAAAPPVLPTLSQPLAVMLVLSKGEPDTVRIEGRKLSVAEAEAWLRQCAERLGDKTPVVLVVKEQVPAAVVSAWTERVRKLHLNPHLFAKDAPAENQPPAGTKHAYLPVAPLPTGPPAKYNGGDTTIPAPQELIDQVQRHMESERGKSKSDAVAAGSPSTALPRGKVCDRNGVVLIEVGPDAKGGAKLGYPLGALGAQVLRGLDSAVLPRNGDTLHLTIDVQAQLAAENALRRIHRGSAVVMDSVSGDILAMASVPSFDPNNPDLAALEADPTEPLRNRALSANAPPGATFLPVTMLAGLAAGLRDFQHECTGSFDVGQRTVMRCWVASRGEGGHGREGFHEGMRNSCNTFFYSLGIAAGPEKICAVAKQIGLGAKTGIPVRDEQAGLVPDTEWFKKHYPKQEWTDRHTASLGIGMGYILVSPLQMTVVAAAMGNGGKVVRPRLIDRTIGTDGKVNRPEVPEGRGFSEVGVLPSDVEIVHRAMLAVVNESGGSGSKAATPGFSIGGRTGTSQFFRGKDTDTVAGFVAFADSDRGHYAVGVFVEGAQSGGGVAAPLASKILASLEVPVPPEKLKPLEPAKGSLDFVGSVE